MLVGVRNVYGRNTLPRGRVFDGGQVPHAEGAPVVGNLTQGEGDRIIYVKYVYFVGFFLIKKCVIEPDPRHDRLAGNGRTWPHSPG